MEGGTQNYRYLLKIFSPEKMKERYLFLLNQTGSIIKNHAEGTGVDLARYISINKEIMQQVMINYFADIDRLKKFHEIETVNCIKIAAYTAYWFSKLRPVQITRQPPAAIMKEYRKLFLKLNEKIALGLMFGIAFENSEILTADPRTTELYISLVYSMAYRVNTPHNFELVLQAHVCTPRNPMLLKIED